MQPRFNPRVCAVICEDGRVLLHRRERDAFWALPGGRIEPGEFSERALAREINEELGREANPVRLLWIVENFFTYDEVPFHEIGLYYLTRVSGIPHDAEFRGAETDLIFRWFDVTELNGIDVRPAPVRDYLGSIPGETQHLCWRD